MGIFILCLWTLAMQPIQTLIGMNIKLARTKRTISQAELANTLGIEASYLSRIEKGRVPVSCERIYQIIKILNCGLEDIFPDPSEVDIQLSKNK
jgi:transcriptional regulator with XRE-family HTH domain